MKSAVPFIARWCLCCAAHSAFNGGAALLVWFGTPHSKQEDVMTDSEHLLPRRTLIKGAGLGLIAGTLPETAAAETGPMDRSRIWSGEYWAKKGDVPLWMYRKRLGPPKAGEPARPLVFFVHGSLVRSRVFALPLAPD